MKKGTKKYIDNGEITEAHGYNFVQNGIEFVDYHVLHHADFQKMGADAYVFGGLLSVQMPPGLKPVIVIGQDEEIFKKYLSMWKAWSCPGGLKALWPKDDDLAIMVSVMVCRELDFGIEWTNNLQRKVNIIRAGEKYSNEEAVVRLSGK